MDDPVVESRAALSNGPPPAKAASGPRLTRITEITGLLAVCGAMFFVGLGRFDFVKTEGLRAIVVQEMLERPGVTLPTVHHRAYLNKPPLYAWTVTGLARLVGRFDHCVARLPSAVAAALLILVLYGAGEIRIGRGAGVAAAAFALCNATVLDYAVRAELDMPFALFASVAILLAWSALTHTGGRSTWAWLGCYLAVTVAAMWKGPHSLIFLWLTLLAYGRIKRRWEWLRQPGQVMGLVASLTVLIAWTVVLSSGAGAKAVGVTAGIELYSRLIPHDAEDLLGILAFLPVTVAVLLPSSLFVLASFVPGFLAGPVPTANSAATNGTDPTPHTQASGPIGLLHRLARVVTSWWRQMRADPFTEFLAVWLVSNLAFMLVVPAKAPRYTLPAFTPVFLLSAWIVTGAGRGPVAGKGRRWVGQCWTLIFRFVAVVGALVVAAGVVFIVLGGTTIDQVTVAPAWPLIIWGIGWLAATVLSRTAGDARAPGRRLIALLIAVLAIKPVVMAVYWPIREAHDTQRPTAVLIDRHTTAGEPVFVLGRNEIPDVAYHSAHAFYWLDDAAEAAEHTDAAQAVFIARVEYFDDPAQVTGGPYRQLGAFERAGKTYRVTEGPVRQAARQP